MNKNIWGKYFWKTIHITALSYPSNPTLEEKATYKSFYYILGDILPCKKCSINYKRHLEEIPIFQYLESKQELFKWTIMLHNIVNRELGRSQWNMEYAQMYYTNLQEHENMKDLKETNNTNNDTNNNNKPSTEKNINSVESRFSSKNYHIPYIMITINIIICFIVLHLILTIGH